MYAHIYYILCTYICTYILYVKNYGVGLLSMKEGKFLPVCPQVIMSVYSYQNKQILGNRKPFKSECEMTTQMNIQI